MPLEIERKYLVPDLGFTQNARHSTITQGYLFSDCHSVLRVRISDDTATLTVKKKISDMERLEYEYPIPLEHAKELITHFCEDRLIEKIRYLVDHEGKTWEIDEFLGANAGLIVAEIELNDKNEKFSLPPWVGEEVTHDGRYINSNLVKHPYSQWKIVKEK
ncbi:MAG: CYTH domain-containing protein [Candidatus Marinimicrobia bacterium]|nr:CYTH domain-containing protein [Candidatus Neomarinimicrobiota bacterium]